MIVIRNLEVTSKFKYLWLKKVNGVDLSVHCARCLLGEYDNRVNARTKSLKNIELLGDVYYLCGVSAPYIWANNFHLAFRLANGEKFTAERNGVKISVENAEIIDFSENDIDMTLPQAKKKEFYTCRNWQFANKILRRSGTIL